MHTTTIVTQRILSHALRMRLGVDADAADESAEHVLDFFGFHDRVIDNVLTPEDRQLFYDLQEHGLLTTRSEETQLWNGLPWRTHYWCMRADRVHAAAEEGARAEAAARAGSSAASVYDDLPAECWARG